jgi:hypothetical protein
MINSTSDCGIYNYKIITENDNMDPTVILEINNNSYNTSCFRIIIDNSENYNNLLSKDYINTVLKSFDENKPYFRFRINNWKNDRYSYLYINNNLLSFDLGSYQYKYNVTFNINNSNTNIKFFKQMIYNLHKTCLRNEEIKTI